MSQRDLSKEVLYEGVKQLVETDAPHIHLTQQKLYTLFSIAFQYMLYNATKKGGHYIIRVEDSYLLDKLQKKSKDQSTRRFIQGLALPRRLKYGNAIFHLDFFNLSTWGVTNELPKERLNGAIVVKNATKKPFGDFYGQAIDEEDLQLKQMLASLPKDYYYTSIKELVPKTIVIAFEESYEDVAKVQFSFIKDEPRERLSKGVNIAKDINWEDLEN